MLRQLTFINATAVIDIVFPVIVTFRNVQTSEQRKLFRDLLLEEKGANPIGTEVLSRNVSILKIFLPIVGRVFRKATYHFEGCLCLLEQFDTL